MSEDPFCRLRLLARAYSIALPSDELRVAVVGLGAVGGWVVRLLLPFGIRCWVLIDDDRLSMGDFNRYAFFDWDKVGEYKAEVVCEAIKAYLRDKVDVKPCIDSVGKRYDFNRLEGIDFLFDCVDGLNGKALLLKHCIQRGIPSISAGASAGIVSVRPQTKVLSEVRVDPLLTRLKKRLKRWKVPCDSVPVVTFEEEVDSRAFGEYSPSRPHRKVLGSWVLSPVAVAIEMVRFFLISIRKRNCIDNAM